MSRRKVGKSCWREGTLRQRRGKRKEEGGEKGGYGVLGPLVGFGGRGGQNRRGRGTNKKKGTEPLRNEGGRRAAEVTEG